MNVISKAIEDLHFDPANLRTHNPKNIKAIADSLNRFGQQKPIIVDSKGIVIAGNGTLEAAKSLGWQQLNVVVTNLETTDRSAFAIADNRTAELADWDTEALKTMLSSLDSEGFDLGEIGFDDDDLKDLELAVKSLEESSLDEETYTNKIESPVYTPTGEKPAISDLCDRTKLRELEHGVAQLDTEDEELTEFLFDAAQRHVKYNYRKIAEYYAHASPEVQDLMEKSALVIIDFNKAIEHGFVQLSKDMALSYDEEAKTYG